MDAVEEADETMKCPMTFGDPCSDRDEECRGRECAWWVVREIASKEVGCCVVAAHLLTAPHVRPTARIEGGRP